MDVSTSPSAAPRRRTRNAEAQAHLRARKKAHIDHLERENEKVKSENERLVKLVETLKRSNSKMSDEVYSLRQSLLVDVNDGPKEAEKRLLKLVQMQRRTIKSLQSTMRRNREQLDLALRQPEHQVDDAECSTDLTQSTSALTESSSPPPAPSLSLGDSSVTDNSPIASTIEEWLMASSWLDTNMESEKVVASNPISIPQPEYAHEVAGTTSHQALSLVLAQPTDFKERVMTALLGELMQHRKVDSQLCPSSGRHKLFSSASIRSSFLSIWRKKNSLVLG